MNDKMVLAFVGWLITVRKVSGSSIKQYMSGLRTVHLKRGFLPGSLRPEILNAIIRGREMQESKERIPRLAMTLPILRLLKCLLSNSQMSLVDRRMFWVVCCLAFHGSFRIHELLSRSVGSFDETSTLLGRDVRLMNTSIDGVKEEFLIIHLKSPKEASLKGGVNVELFTTGDFSCPVSAWKKWRALVKRGLDSSKPVFRFESGRCLNGATFNKELKSFLGSYIDYDKRRFLSHSFRAGRASMMASAGYRDEEIIRQGRWNSNAFKVYCKTGRANRLKEQRDIARTLSNI